MQDNPNIIQLCSYRSIAVSQYRSITVSHIITAALHIYMKILIIGNSPPFSQSLATFLTNSPPLSRSSSNPHSQSLSSSLRFKSEIIDFDLAIACIEPNVWALEALQVNGIIYALVHQQTDYDYWPVTCDSFAFVTSIYKSKLHNLFPNLPTILVSPSRDSFSNFPFRPKRCLEIDPETGENCHLALISLVYWIRNV